MSSSAAGDCEPLVERIASACDFELAICQRQAIDDAIATLPEEQRALIELRDIQGLGYHEIAAIAGIPIGTVESRLFRARQRLRPLLEHLLARQAIETVD